MLVAFRVVDKLRIRLEDWLNGLRHGDYTYQVTQSLIGLGAGGWRGLGVGQSHNKFAFLPESHTDFAFSVLGEEWGLFGTLPVIVMLVIIAWRGYGIAARAVEPFGRILAAGVTALPACGVEYLPMLLGATLLGPGPVDVQDPHVRWPAKGRVFGGMEEMIQQFKSVTEGPRVPAGEAYFAIESANGELGFYLVSDGSSRPVKVRCRPPSFINLAPMPEMLRGALLADLIPTFDFINMVGGECDR